MTMKRFLLALSSMFALALPSCLQSETTIRLNKDGSGTLTEETTFGEQVTAMLAQFGALGGGGEDPLADMFSEEKSKARASQFGEGVTFEKAELIQRGANRGGRVTYRFDDINTFRIVPGKAMQNLAPGAEAAAVADKAPPVTFAYAGGKLTIKMPEPEVEGPAAPDGGANPAAEASNPEMEAMLKEMLADMKMSFKIVIEPGIAETNATHHEGNTITMMELEFGELLKKEGVLQKLSSIDQNDTQAAMAVIKDIEGVKFEAKNEVSVTIN